MPNNSYESLGQLIGKLFLLKLFKNLCDLQLNEHSVPDRTQTHQAIYSNSETLSIDFHCRYYYCHHHHHRHYHLRLLQLLLDVLLLLGDDSSQGWTFQAPARYVPQDDLTEEISISVTLIGERSSCDDHIPDDIVAWCAGLGGLPGVDHRRHPRT